MNIIEQYRELERRAEPMLKAAGLTLNQYQVAEAILTLGQPTMGQVSEYLHGAPSTMTDSIDRLERNGVIQRVRDTKDRRAIRLTLVDIGRFEEQRCAMQRLQEAVQRDAQDVAAVMMTA